MLRQLNFAVNATTLRFFRRHNGSLQLSTFVLRFRAEASAARRSGEPGFIYAGDWLDVSQR